MGLAVVGDFVGNRLGEIDIDGGVVSLMSDTLEFAAVVGVGSVLLFSPVALELTATVSVCSIVSDDISTVVDGVAVALVATKLELIADGATVVALTAIVPFAIVSLLDNVLLRLNILIALSISSTISSLVSI